MKKILFIIGIISFASCETSDTCSCEVYENIGTEEKPQLRYIGKLEGDCESQVQEEKYVYQTVNC
ncbi:MAG TPA: hypothetical protein VLY87_06110 [Flavobacterium sp.]|nr:hypothetical protein [Flavobacterium sp.]